MRNFILTLLSAVVLSAASADSNSQEVLAAMDAYKNALIHNDGVALEKLLGNDLYYVHSNGVLQTKAELIKSMTSGKTVIERIEFLPDTNVRVYGNIAAVTGQADFKTPTNTGSRTRVLYVWRKGSQGWQLVDRQATLTK